MSSALWYDSNANGKSCANEHENTLIEHTPRAHDTINIIITLPLAYSFSCVLLCSLFYLLIHTSKTGHLAVYRPGCKLCLCM